MEQCIQAIRPWMIKDKLRLNDNKMEFMIIGTRKQVAKVNIDGLSVGESIIAPLPSVRNLGLWFVQDMYSCVFSYLQYKADQKVP